MSFPLPAKVLTCFPIAFFFLTLWTPTDTYPAQENRDEETYSISLVQTAHVERETHEVEGRKVLSESYTVQEGDHIWSILRSRGLLEKKNLNEILSILKSLNNTLGNLDLIHPGQNILIPLVISPITGNQTSTDAGPPEELPIETLKDLKLENYTIEPGDSLIKVVTSLYDIPSEELYNEYLALLKKVNPSIRDLNFVRPGQKVKLPIYSPEVVRLPVKTPPPGEKPEPKKSRESIQQLGQEIGKIFTLMGEEWVNGGEQFIPLKSGGQINLNADSFPILDLRNGKKVIVDMYNDLPAKLAGLITSSWDNYSIVHIKPEDTLETSTGRIIHDCGYDRVYGPDESLKLGGDIPLEITGDWIIGFAPGQSSEKTGVIVLNIFHDSGPRTPVTIRTFLERIGIRVIDYPPGPETPDKPVEDGAIIEARGDVLSLTKTLLELTGKTFLNKVDIPVYKSSETELALIIKADFFLNLDGRDCIIDLSGLGQDMITMLREQRFSVLSITDKKFSSTVLLKILDFLGVAYDSKPHPFMALDRGGPRNIRLRIPGVIFKDSEDRSIFASQSMLPGEIANFLAAKGYRILLMPSSRGL